MKWYVFLTVLTAALAMGLGASPRASEASAPLVGCADFDGDGIVTQTDVDLQTAGLGAQLGEYEYLLLYDNDADGIVTQSDVDATAAQIGSACPLIDTQVTQATLAVLDYRDINVALADGFVQGTQSIAGHGVHYINWARVSDNVFDITQPEGLNYTTSGRLIAVYYIVPIWVTGNETAPDGFDGDEDHWHYHNGLCQWQTAGGPAVAENVSEADCLSRPGGVWFEKFGWMQHLWNFQHNPMGRFMMENPDIGSSPDLDGDGVADGNDNCPLTPNVAQLNTDAAPIDNGPDIPGDDVTVPNGDSLGDACDDDRDNDWMLDTGTNPALSIPGEDIGCGSGPTDPLTPDSDGDLVLDGAECLLGSDPNDPTSRPAAVPPGDGDGDGLSAAVETLVGSSDSTKDSDGDGIPDGLEVKGWGTSPASIDTDGDSAGSDGCKDDKEVASINGDTQANILDLYFVAQMSSGLLPADPALDLNKDGVSNVLDSFLTAKNSNLLEPHTDC